VWYKNLDRSFFRFVRDHACDRQTEGQTEFSSLYRVCITCSAVKTSKTNALYLPTEIVMCLYALRYNCNHASNEFLWLNILGRTSVCACLTVCILCSANTVTFLKTGPRKFVFGMLMRPHTSTSRVGAEFLLEGGPLCPPPLNRLWNYDEASVHRTRISLYLLLWLLFICYKIVHEVQI